MQTKVVTVTSPGSTGAVAYTGVGFQPKALFAIGGKLAAGDSAGANLLIAAHTAAGAASAQGLSTDNLATSESASNRGTGLISVRGATGTAQTVGGVTALGADGFTITWTTVTIVRVFYILCIGGADVEAAAGFFTAGAATGNRSVTGLSFRPNTLIFFDSRVSTLQTGAEVYWRPMLGFVDSAGNQGAESGDSWDNQATSTTSRNQTSAGCIAQTMDTGGALDKGATFVSYNADGFTVNFGTLNGVAPNSYTCYLALSVPFSQVGNFNTRTTTGTTATATTGFTPKALIIGGNRRGAGNAAADHFFSVGIAASATEEAYSSHHDEDGLATTNVSGGQNTDGILRWMTANGATPTTVLKAQVTDMSYENFTLDYSTVEATARLINYLAMGDAPVGGGARSFAAVI